jgi:hypothetical protein
MNEQDELLKVFIDGKGTFYQRVKLSTNIEKEQDTGYLYCKNAILGHVGVQAYNGYEVGITDQKVVYVRREEQDVFDEESMNSIKGKPVTLNHPDEMVNSKNFKDYVVGFIDEVWRDGDNIVGVIVIQDEKAIQAVEQGELKDLSLGYTAKLVPIADGQFKQQNIVINHLAIVSSGRAKNARIVDNETVAIPPTNELNSEVIKEGEKKVMKTFIDFMNEFKVIDAMPKSEFRDKAYETLNVECKEVLKVDLPSLTVVRIKDSAIEKSVGLKDTQEEQQTPPQPKVMKIYAQDEEAYFKKLYRSMDKVENARKYANMSYMDVIEELEGRKK